MKQLIIPVLLIILMISVSGFIIQKESDEKSIYTAHNIWFENPKKVFAMNFKRGIMIPAGTRVYNINYTEGSPYYIQLNIDGFQERISVYIVYRWQHGLKETQLIKRMFTYKTFEELTAELSVEEIEQIKKGEVELGMSRRAVLISYGYPPLHRTPNLDNKIWCYWLSRNRQKMIEFDENWKVSQITN